MDHLLSLLSPNEVITPQSDPAAYDELTTFWCAQANQKPIAVVAPTDAQSLAKVIPYLYNNTEHNIRFLGRGYTSLPAKDILLSMHKFDSFSYNPHEQTITVGAGQHWLTVYEAVDIVAPKFTVVGARTPSVSVGGTITTGGFGWLSGDLGCISDPKNLLDVEVVKYDGSVVWASSEPELLWAIRGGGGGFGAITRAIFRLHETPRSVYYGTIVVPKSSLPQAAAHLSRFTNSAVGYGISLFMFIQRESYQQMHLVNFKDEREALVFQVFDANGEAHGRQTFQWVHDLPGAQDFTKAGTILELIRIQDRVSSMSGHSQQYSNPMVVPEFTEDQVHTCAKWFSDLAKRGDSIAENTFMVFELFVTRDSDDAKAMSWPGPRGCKHMLVLAVGCGVDAPAEEVEAAKSLAEAAPQTLLGGDPRITPAPNSFDDWTDATKIYGSSRLAKLKQLRATYDPKNRFGAHVNGF